PPAAGPAHRAHRHEPRCRRPPPPPTRPPASDARPPGRSHPASTTADAPASAPRSLLSTSAFLPRRRCRASDLSWSPRKVRRALERVADPQLQVIPLALRRIRVVLELRVHPLQVEEARTVRELVRHPCRDEIGQMPNGCRFGRHGTDTRRTPR